MTEPCNPRIVEKAHLEARSWRKAAQVLNKSYGVSLSHAAWRDYAIGRQDIADPEIRARLHLPARACPTCGYKQTERKPKKSRRIRAYGYSSEKPKTFLEVIELQNVPR